MDTATKTQARDYVKDPPTQKELEDFRKLRDHFNRLNKHLPPEDREEIPEEKKFIQLFQKNQWIVIQRRELSAWHQLSTSKKREQVEIFQEKLRKGQLIIAGKQPDGCPMVVSREVAKRMGLVPTEIHEEAETLELAEILPSINLELSAYRIDKDIRFQSNKNGEEVLKDGYLVQAGEKWIHLPANLELSPPVDIAADIKELPARIQVEGKTYVLGFTDDNFGWVNGKGEFYWLWPLGDDFVLAVRNAQAFIKNNPHLIQS